MKIKVGDLVWHMHKQGTDLAANHKSYSRLMDSNRKGFSGYYYSKNSRNDWVVKFEAMGSDLLKELFREN